MDKCLEFLNEMIEKVDLMTDEEYEELYESSKLIEEVSPSFSLYPSYIIEDMQINRNREGMTWRAKCLKENYQFLMSKLRWR